MMRLIYREVEARANGPAPKSLQEEAGRNALIEALCVHARSLIDFFSDKRSKKSDAIASDFTTGFVTGLDLTKEGTLDCLRTKLNKHIFHLTTDRTIVDSKKFDVGKDGLKLLEMLEPEIIKFTAALRPDFGSFKCQTSPLTAFGLPFSSCTALAAQTVVVNF
jgi:hypothetical protein